MFSVLYLEILQTEFRVQKNTFFWKFFFRPKILYFIHLLQNRTSNTFTLLELLYKVSGTKRFHFSFFPNFGEKFEKKFFFTQKIPIGIH